MSYLNRHGEIFGIELSQKSSNMKIFASVFALATTVTANNDTVQLSVRKNQDGVFVVVIPFLRIPNDLKFSVSIFHRINKK